MAGVHEARTGGDASGRRSRRPRRVLVFPLPFQGHINPMLQLADALHERGLAVTVLHTHFNAMDPARHPEFRFVPVPDGVPDDVAASGNVIDILGAMNTAMEAQGSGAVRGVLESVLADEDQQPVACIVLDANLLAVPRAAEAVGLKTLVLRTTSAACFGCCMTYPMLYQKDYLPPQESKMNMPVKELPPLRVRDLFYSSWSDQEKMSNLLVGIIEAVKNSSGLLINTFDALEQAELERIREGLRIPMVLAPGSLHKLSSKRTGSSLLDQDYDCIKWLDKQLPKSVLYVSFGSLASLDADEFIEVAWGLATGGHPFLWVVRPGLVRGLDGPDFLSSFEAAIEGRGKVIQWAPQNEVLAHHAVGGFWTQNGWNSTLESINEGVPMICRPQFADQMMNTRYVEKKWGVGFELEAGRRAPRAGACRHRAPHALQRAGPAHHLEFQFVADVAASGNVIDIVDAMNAAMEAEESAAVRGVLASALGDKGQPPAACIVFDPSRLAVPRAAAAHGLPTLALFMKKAICLLKVTIYQSLYQNFFLNLGNTYF
ncbi:DIMBOA UDP-glucosyltransferase BX9 [Dichanthelium oligosanthes]|uniref:DIMBOA UDP-glucosyltransferase BX9 n=1 Tax=Dichanthelium oligosanthes TaxID=888268 RepID=A0A1E5V896_9POAL|nr:DIMBOA UDP-glucosyltransferase BX9 [Dichanthelium oligosanthes]